MQSLPSIASRPSRRRAVVKTALHKALAQLQLAQAAASSLDEKHEQELREICHRLEELLSELGKGGCHD